MSKEIFEEDVEMEERAKKKMNQKSVINGVWVVLIHIEEGLKYS